MGRLERLREECFLGPAGLNSWALAMVGRSISAARFQPIIGSRLCSERLTLAI